jgi:hypothetical protein
VPIRVRLEQGMRRARYAACVAALVLVPEATLAQAASVLPTEILKYETKVRNAGTIPSGEQGTIGSYIGISALWNDISECAAQDVCPDIILLDTPVRADQNLTIQIIGDLPATLTTVSGPDPIPLSQAEDHGTEMAGIIAAQKGTRGVVGVNPEGRVYSVDWDNYGASEARRSALVGVLGNSITHSKNNPPIIVLASGWRSELPISKLPCGGGQRFPSRGALENFFSIRPGILIIVSAGDDRDKNISQDITRNSTFAPQNMGDCENVIVVTACSECDKPIPKIPDWANYSTEGLVQIAAYGGDILTTKGNGYLTVMSGGTSAAAGFVAGVASAMMAKWPSFYNFRPADLKFRLQLTSTPFEGAKLSAGILDAMLAFKDPGVDYLSVPNSKSDPVKIAGWCVDQIQVSKNGGTSADVIDVSNVYRIYCPSIDQCTVYHADLQQRQAGIVQRSGPGAIVGNILLSTNRSVQTVDLTNPVIFETADGSTYRPGEFIDIVLNTSRQPIIGQSSCK